MKPEKERPLGTKAFPKIPHLPGSRTGTSDRTAPPELARRCTEQSKRGDTIVVEEKLDGSCVAVARLADTIVALGREGFRATESENPGRQMFARWVAANTSRFTDVLQPGEWLVGEWLALAHSTRYRLTHEPFVVFDLFTATGALATSLLDARLGDEFARPARLHTGDAISISAIDAQLGAHGSHGALDAVEGAVWRVERDGVVLHRAKFVRAGKVDGAFLPENSGRPAVWNWSD